VSILHRMLLRTFVPVFLVAMLFFVLLFQLIDVFSSIWRYFAHDVTLLEIARIALLYLPRCISYSLPVAFLFAIANTLGGFYAGNELFAIFGSGVSLYRLVTPFLVLGVALSAAGFFFEDEIVIPSYRQKTEAYARAVKLVTSLSQSNVTVTSPDQRVVYQADYYNDAQKRLTGLTVVVRGPDMALERRVDAVSADWTGTRWSLRDCRVFTWDPAAKLLSEEKAAEWQSPEVAEPPDTFKKLARSVEEMDSVESRRYVAAIRRAGLPYRAALTSHYRKFSFACTPLIVALIASSLGSTFRKNVLLMSLLSALVISVGFYVMQMVASILSKNGYIPPLAGAWTPFTLFLVLGFMLFRSART
jgi:lipopolysaccharide export system permease protein